MANLKEISEQARWINEKSVSAGSSPQQYLDWESMDTLGWRHDPYLGFFRIEDKFYYQIFTSIGGSVVLKKTETGFGSIKATVPIIGDDTFFYCAGSEQVELSYDEIFDTFYSLNLAITLYQDGDNQSYQDLI